MIHFCRAVFHRSKAVRRASLAGLYGSYLFSLTVLCPGSLFAESRVWTSTSGSTIEAEYLGRFGEELWFVAVGNERLLKMPEKYISPADLNTITSGEIQPKIEEHMLDTAPESIALFEALWTTPAPTIQSQDLNLNDCLDQLIAPLRVNRPQDAPPLIKFHQRNDKRIKLTTTTPREGNLYAVVTSILADAGRAFQIKQGSLIIRR